MESYRYIIWAALIVSLLLIHTSNTTIANEPNWPQFRGPNGLGIAPDSQPYPANLDVSKNLLWKIDIPRGHSSPCIWGDNIFITASSGKSLETICINRENGGIKWSKSVEVDKLERVNSSNSHATPTPVCDGKRVYVYFGSFGLLAYDMEGHESWRKSLPDPEIWYGTASSPVLANDKVIINLDPGKGSYILAVDQNTGETVWRKERQVHGLGWATPVLWRHGDEQELVVHGVGQLVSYDLKDGHKRWWFDCLKSTMTGAALTPVYSEDTLFLATVVGRSGDPVNPIELPDYNELIESYDTNGDNRLEKTEIPEELSMIYRRGPEGTGIKNRFAEFDVDKDGSINKAEWIKVVTDTEKISPIQMDALYAIQAGGKDDVSQTHVQWIANEGIGQVSSPLFYQGRIYLVKHAGNITCYNAKTGDKIYGDRAGPRAYYFASPVAADNKIYFCSMNGFIIIVEAGDKFKVLSQNKLLERMYATPALLDGKIYIRTDKSIYAFMSAEDESDRTTDIAVIPDKHEVIERPPDKVESDQAGMLYKAAAAGDIEKVKSLISGGSDVNTTNEWGWTPLYVASAIGNIDIANLLITKGANVNVSNERRETPLQLAVKNNHMDMVKLLIENGADYHMGDEDGVTPLHTTAEQGFIEITALMIDKGVDINVKDKWIWTPIHYACWKNQKETAEFLMKKGADYNIADEDGSTPLHTATERGHIDIVTLLVDAGADLNVKNNSGQIPLHLAFRRGREEIAELLIAKGADVNAISNDGWTPLRYAVVRGYKDLVELLLNKGAEFKAPNSSGRTVVGFAIQQGRKEIVEILQKYAKQSGDTNDILTFYDYVAAGDIEQVKSFVSKGMDINAKTQDGMTALHWAATGHKAVAEYLISKGADINTENNNGLTPLHVATLSNSKDLIELLLMNGADVNAKFGNGVAPLLTAAGRGRKEIVELLIDKGADVNTKNNAGQTPLFFATRRGYTEIVELLKKHGAKE